MTPTVSAFLGWLMVAVQAVLVWLVFRIAILSDARRSDP